jgi:hypothetical protein
MKMAANIKIANWYNIARSDLVVSTAHSNADD